MKRVRGEDDGDDGDGAAAAAAAAGAAADGPDDGAGAWVAALGWRRFATAGARGSVAQEESAATSRGTMVATDGVLLGIMTLRLARCGSGRGLREAV